ncbi:MAG: orotate phosphoribosyltransferase [Bacteroidota bacterium]
MILDKDSANKTAELLMQINAIKLSPESPFTWASGWKSPIYCDNRILLSYPKIRDYVKDQMVRQIQQLYGSPDVIAGVATGAIGLGMLVADVMELPFVYVRPEPKAHGRKNQIEGQLDPDKTVVVVEDLISTGKSSLNAVKALKASNANVLGMIAVFTYGFSVAEENFAKNEVALHTLSDYTYLVQQAAKSDYLKKEQLQTLLAWKNAPDQWKP